MKTRIAGGLALMFASFPCFGAGGFIIHRTVDQTARAEARDREVDAQCRDRLKNFVKGSGEFKDIGAEGGPKGFEITVRNVTDPRKSLADVTVAQALCPLRTVTSVCLGEACDKSVKGVTLRFRMLGRAG